MRRLSDFQGHPIESIFLETQMGQVNGSSIFWKFGHTDLATTSISDIWKHGGVYNFPSVATQASLVSTESDNSVLQIEGLDADFNQVSETVTLNGTTPVLTANNYIRINNAYNASSTPLNGDITLSINGQTAAFIKYGDEVISQSNYTIPAGYTGYMFQGFGSTGKLKDADILFKYRMSGGVFMISEQLGLYQNTVEASRPFLPFPEKTDIRVQALSSSSNTSVSIQYGILLLDNSVWKN